MATSRSVAGMGYVGIPALLFLESLNYGRGTQTYEEKRICLHKQYAQLRAILPEQYDKETKCRDYNERIHPVLLETAVLIKLARDQYKPTFEGMRSCDPDEKEFQETMDTIVEKLYEIMAISKIIDKEKLENQEVIF